MLGLSGECQGVKVSVPTRPYSRLRMETRVESRHVLYPNKHSRAVAPPGYRNRHVSGLEIKQQNLKSQQITTSYSVSLENILYHTVVLFSTI